MSGWMNQWVSEWMDEWMSEWMPGNKEELKDAKKKKKTS